MRIVRVYNGVGCSANSAAELNAQFGCHGSISRTISEQEIALDNDWIPRTSHLVFSLRSTSQCKAGIGENGLEKVRRGVYDGAFNLVAIGGGPALFAKLVKYRMFKEAEDKTTPPIKETISYAGLGIFNGIAKGPCYAVTHLPFSGKNKDLYLVSLKDKTTGEQFTGFYWGGLHFVPDRRANNIDVITKLDTSKNEAIMALSFPYGKGTVHFFGYHPELHERTFRVWVDEEDEPEKTRLDEMLQRLSPNSFPRFLRQIGLG